MSKQSNVQRIPPLKADPDWVAPNHPQLLLLRNWQSERLSHTYADYYAKKRYRLAYQFFLNDIYSPSSFSELHHDLERLYRTTATVLPENMLKALRITLELYNLSEALDQRLLRVLVDQLGMSDRLTAAQYAEAYRRCDNLSERKRQLDLIMQVTKAVEELSRQPFISTTLRLARRPARLAGWSNMHSFLERGLAAFKQMKSGGDHFFQTVYEREMRILEQLFARHPDPFAL